MVAIFSTKDEAQKFTDKCHAWLQDNCPDYNAMRWQQPVMDKSEKLFYIEVPSEFYKDFYQQKTEKIAVICDAELKTASVVQDKIPDDFLAVADIHQ